MKFITMHFRKRVGGSIISSVKFWQFKKMAPLKFGKKKKFYYTHFSFIILYNYNGCINKHILKGKKEMSTFQTIFTIDALIYIFFKRLKKKNPHLKLESMCDYHHTLSLSLTF